VNESLIGTILAAALGGGLFSRIWDRWWKGRDAAKKETVEEKKLELGEGAQIRQELLNEVRDIRMELRRVQDYEETWRIKYWEAVGVKQTLETELHTIRPRYIELIQQNQHLIAENETLKLRAGRRISDHNTDALYRIEQTGARIEKAGAVAADAAEHVATELRASQGRADIVDGHPGEAADAASRSSNGDNEGGMS
jgi:hypothetical protein